MCFGVFWRCTPPSHCTCSCFLIFRSVSLLVRFLCLLFMFHFDVVHCRRRRCCKILLRIFSVFFFLQWFWIHDSRLLLTTGPKQIQIKNRIKMKWKIIMKQRTAHHMKNRIAWKYSQQATKTKQAKQSACGAIKERWIKNGNITRNPFCKRHEAMDVFCVNAKITLK